MTEAVKIAKQYYDTTETDKLYAAIWGGEHINYGIYTRPDEPIHGVLFGKKKSKKKHRKD